MKLREYADREMMMIDLANVLAGELKGAIIANGRASLAVPGGSTPGPMFDALCAADLDWDVVTVLPTDDRWVPEISDHSNARLIKERLLVERAAAARYLSLVKDGAPRDAIASLTDDVAAVMPLSIVVLGMGGDMHTASLFPGDPILAPGEDKTALLHYVPVPGLEPKVPRMTLTATALNSALSKHIVLTGVDKRTALERAQSLGDPVAAPILAVYQGATIHWAE